MSDLLEFTLGIARAGGHVLRERYGQPREIYAKGWRDFYTDADLAAQDLIVERILARDPHAAILSEEGLRPPPEAAACWVIDPLDGTTNYSRRVGWFAVSIAYVEQGRPIAGVVYDPLRDQVFAAERQRGAWLNTERIRVATTTAIAEAIIGLDWSREEQSRRVALNWLSRAGQECRTIRAIGSAALAMCYLAAGQLDVYFHGALKPWDGAAGQVIAEEAGARLFNFRGDAWTYTEPDCVMCTPALEAWALRSLPQA